MSKIEIILMVPPAMILGLESPGIPGGGGFFMSPIIAVLLSVPDQAIFVTTFITVYSGLIPMLCTAGNTTDDGIVGAFIQDRFAHFLNIVLTPARQLQQEAKVQLEEVSQHV